MTAPAARRQPRRSVLLRRRPSAGGPGALVGGAGMLWLSLIVLSPLAAIVATAFAGGLGGFVDAVTAPAALSALGVTLAVALAVTGVNAVIGTVIAWVLVRDDFPGKRVIDTAIDLPFALPTIVASIVLLALYGPSSPVGLELQHTFWGVCAAVAFVTLPFVVRAVQPVLSAQSREVEQAAAALGAGPVTVARLILLPALIPAIAAGAGLSLCRALGEFGAVILIGGAIPGETEVASQYIRALVEQDDPVSAAAVSTALLVISLAGLGLLRGLSRRLTPGAEAGR